MIRSLVSIYIDYPRTGFQPGILALYNKTSSNHFDPWNSEYPPLRSLAY